MEREEALVAAAEQRDPALVAKLLAQGTSPAARDVFGFSAIHWAAARDDRETLRLLLRAGAAVDTRDASGNTPLMAAAARGSCATVKELLARGADPNARGCRGWTALHCAAQHGWSGVVQALLVAGARVSARRQDGVTPLHLAAGNGSAEAIRALVDHGAEVNAKDQDGTTPLLQAVVSRETAAVRLLIACGADPDTPSRKHHGETPLAYARADHSWQLAALLLHAHITRADEPRPAASPRLVAFAPRRTLRLRTQRRSGLRHPDRPVRIAASAPETLPAPPVWIDIVPELDASPEPVEPSEEPPYLRNRRSVRSLSCSSEPHPDNPCFPLRKPLSIAQ